MNVTFVSKGSNRYCLQVTPEQQVPDSFGVLHVVNVAKVISFDGGVYKTSKPDVINAIRSTDAFKEGRVFELAQGRIVPKSKPTPVVRGALSSKSIHAEAGVEEAIDKKMSLQEKGLTKCDECQKQFTEDYQGFKLRGHMISHRRKK